jgi:hypothetical protein
MSLAAEMKVFGNEALLCPRRALRCNGAAPSGRQVEAATVISNMWDQYAIGNHGRLYYGTTVRELRV